MQVNAEKIIEAFKSYGDTISSKELVESGLFRSIDCLSSAVSHGRFPKRVGMKGHFANYSVADVIDFLQNKKVSKAVTKSSPKKASPFITTAQMAKEGWFKSTKQALNKLDRARHLLLPVCTRGSLNVYLRSEFEDWYKCKQEHKAQQNRPSAVEKNETKEEIKSQLQILADKINELGKQLLNSQDCE